MLQLVLSLVELERGLQSKEEDKTSLMVEREQGLEDSLFQLSKVPILNKSMLLR